jgi:hypothetical protein
LIGVADSFLEANKKASLDEAYRQAVTEGQEAVGRLSEGCLREGFMKAIDDIRKIRGMDESRKSAQEPKPPGLS